IALLITADLLTKHFEVEYCWELTIIPNVVVIHHGVPNYGVAFGLHLGQIPILIITFILLAVMVFAFIFMPNRFIILKVAISLVIAGAIGNIVDRIALGYVRDWFGLWMFGKIAYCNFADFWIVIGAILAVIDLMFINEYSVFPLTKKSKEIQKAKKEEEERKKNLKPVTDAPVQTAEPELPSEETAVDATQSDGNDNNDANN
ncbi:MAG: signal peptidase II, partial [Clostridia bacterium]|nr:signal peptidase II [Clostridia bacterium]